MTMFRVRFVDGTTRSVAAGQVVVNRDRRSGSSRGETPAGSPSTGCPSPRSPRVERRFNEPDGRVLWVDESGVNTAAAAARPHQSLPDPAQEKRAAVVSRGARQRSATRYARPFRRVGRRDGGTKGTPARLPDLSLELAPVTLTAARSGTTITASRTGHSGRCCTMRSRSRCSTERGGPRTRL